MSLPLTSLRPRPDETIEEETTRLVRHALAVSRPDMELIAKKSGLSVHTLWSWHTGRRVPRKNSLKKLALALREISEQTMLAALRLREWDDD